MLKKILPASKVLMLFAFAFANNQAFSQNDDPSIALDTISISPEKPKAKNYRASVTRSNDIIHTKLEVKFDWQNSWMYGKATLDIQPYFYTVKKLFLDARGMDIYKVQLVKGTAFSDLKYVYENDSIKIDLDKEYKKGEAYKIFIDYKSKPEELKKGGSMAISSDKGLYFINPKGEDPDKMPQIWTQGETQSNSAWFPCIDSPNEKMTEEIYMTVDKKYTTLSNGLMKDQKANADGTRTDHWVMDMPHSTYLVMMAVGEFKVVKDTWEGKDVWYYVEKEYEPHAKAIFGNTPEMLAFFSGKLGVKFPWQKYSQIVCRDYVSGAMENTTATLHGDFVYGTDRELLDGDQEDVISHELFHQWFGDYVTAESWSNLPLNESFATYGEYLWNEYKYGKDKADEGGQSDLKTYLAESSRKIANLIRFEYSSREDMFDAHSYQKGGRVLHMLRKYVGDDAFFASLKLYLERYKFQPAEMHMLRLCFEEVTGEDLNWFFNQWFYSKGHPQLQITTAYDAATKKVTVKTSQMQDFERIPLFRLPVKIDIYAGGKVRREMIWINEADQVFEFKNVDAKPDLVNFDAEKSLLCEKSQPGKGIDEYVFQYKNAPLYVDRLEALEYLKNYSTDPKGYEVIKLALNDKYDGLREQAIGLLNDAAEKKEAELKPILIGLAKNDKKAGVRSAAIGFLAGNYKGKDLIPVYQAGLTDLSYNVLGTSLNGLAKEDPQAALAQTKKLENEKSSSVLFSVMDIYANYGNESNYDFFVKNVGRFQSFHAIGFYNLFGVFLKRCNDETVIKGAEFIKDRLKSNPPGRFVVFYAQKAIKDQVNRYQDKEDDLQSKIEDAKKAGKSAAEFETQLSKVKETKTRLSALYEDVKK